MFTGSKRTLAPQICHSHYVENALNWISVGGTAIGVIALIVTIVIAVRQNTQSSKQQILLLEVGFLLDHLHGLTRDNARMLEEMRELQILEDPSISDGPDAEPDALVPANKDALIQHLKSVGALLTWDHLVWRKKRTIPPTRGNLGWFVYSHSTGQRWFVHSGRTITARPAVPMDRIDEWERQVRGAQPEQIRIDYQTGSGRGNHAWYIETYSGETWKLSKGGLGTRGVTVTRVDDEVDEQDATS